MLPRCLWPVPLLQTGHKLKSGFPTPQQVLNRTKATYIQEARVVADEVWMWLAQTNGSNKPCKTLYKKTWQKQFKINLFIRGSQWVASEFITLATRLGITHPNRESWAIMQFINTLQEKISYELTYNSDAQIKAPVSQRESANMNYYLDLTEQVTKFWIWQQQNWSTLVPSACYRPADPIVYISSTVFDNIRTILLQCWALYVLNPSLTVVGLADPMGDFPFLTQAKRFY